MRNDNFMKFYFRLSVGGILLLALGVSAQTTPAEFDLANLRKNHPDFTVAYDRIKIQNAWELINARTTLLQEVVLGLIEDGVDKNHPEFSGVELGRTPPALFTDLTGHGTSVAGIIGANNVSATTTLLKNSPQMNGILSGAKGLSYVMGIRAMRERPDQLEPSLNDLIDTGGARIINLSLGLVRETALSDAQKPFAKDLGATNERRFKEWSNFFNDYVAKHPNIIFSVAAGNENVDVKDATPANSTLPNAIVVAASDVSDPDASKESRAIFRKQNTDIIQASNFGVGIMAAPGTNVYAPATLSLPEGLGFEDYRQPNHPKGFFKGTSASAPIVTGVAGLIKAIKPELTPAQIKQILIETGDPISTDQSIGPRLNAEKAVCHPLVLNCAPPPPAAPIWPMLQKNAQHTGLSDVSGPPFATSSEVKVKWQKSLGAGTASFSPLIASDGTVYAASGSNLFAFEGATGNQKWQTIVPGTVHAGAIGPDGIIYICSNSSVGGTLSAFDSVNGQKRWSFIVGGPTPCMDPVIDKQGTIYTAVPPPINIQTAVVIAINPDGTQKWRYEEINTAASSPALSNDESQVYAALNNHLVAFSAADGHVLWTQNGNFVFSMAPVVDSQDRVLITSLFSLQDLGFVNAFSKSGALLWVSPNIGPVEGSSALNSQNQAIIAAIDKLFILDSSNGKIISSIFLPSGQAQVSHLAVDKNNIVYITFTSGEIPQLGVVAADSGAIRWSFPTSKRIFGAPALGTTGTLYFIAENILFALGE